MIMGYITVVSVVAYTTVNTRVTTTNNSVMTKHVSKILETAVENIKRYNSDQKQS